MVGGQSTSLIRTNDIGATESLDTGQIPDNRVLLCHLLRTESQTGGDDSSQPFGDSSYRQRDGNLEVVHSTFQSTVMCGIPEVTNVDEPDEDTNDRDDFGEHVTKVVEFTLERSLFTDL